MEKNTSNTELAYNNRRVWLRALTASLGYFIFGFVLGNFTSSQECMASILGWGDNKDIMIVIISTLVPVGAFVGSILTGFMSKASGKRKNIMITDILTIISSLIILYPHTITFAIGRFTSGLCVGNFSILCSQYITEVTPKEIRAKFGNVNQLLTVIGIFMAFAICLPLPTSNCSESIAFYVPLLFALPGIIAGIQFLMLLKIFKNESPEWLLYNKSINTTYKAISSIYAKEQAEKIMTELVSFKTSNTIGKTSGFTFIQLLKCAPGSTKSMRVASLYHIASQLTGVTALLSYLTRLFIEFGIDVFLSRCLITGITFIRIISILLFLPHVAKFGRKSITVFSEAIMSFCMLILGIFIVFNIEPLVSVLIITIYLIVFNLSVGPIVWIYSSEVLCDKGMALCTSINWFICIFVVLFYPVLVKTIGMEYSFLGICVLDGVAAIYFYFDMVETKNLSKPEIREIYSKLR
ncbi:hypothetical protein SteCoe_11400 [Stentor coeruleus]|uniref:Hexose transporter 1 n=1 Tax=Stentor coeruleus TaxID=5963 RepID=A0A1R2CDB5_9CILI|nr:hypothetical protein SteCoe_11400 [Stentor coeruleus]